MSRAHITSRIIGSATAPLVRNAGPAVAEAFKHFLQFIGFLLLGSAVLIAAAIAGANGLPWPVTKTVALIIGLVPVGFGLLVVIEQIRLTYEKRDPSIYDAVEPFEQRRPLIDG